VLLVKAWLLLPVLLALIALGWGLLIERASAARLSGALLVPVGLAAVMVVARAAMTMDATAELATPAVVLGALGGLALGRDRLGVGRVDRWAAAGALAVFALYAAPIVLSGSATFAGYTVLGDTAIHFALVDRIATHGTDLAGLPPSSYRTSLEAYFVSGYPLGAHAALAAVRPLAFVDVAWAFQPFLAFVAAALTLSLFGLLEGLVRSAWRRAAVAVLAAQPALVYGYAMQGSIKEIVTLWLVPLLAALVARLVALPHRAGLRQTLPLGVACAAGVAAIGVAVGVWLGPMLLVALLLVATRRPRAPRQTAVLAVGFAAVVTVLSLPTLLDLGDYLEVTKDVITGQQEIGNLLRPLDFVQVFGIWFNGDYRLPPQVGTGIDKAQLTFGLIGIAAAAGVLGLIWLVRRRALGPLLFLTTSLIALWYVTRTGSPWADGKALAIAAPAVLLMAALGPIALEARDARLEALALACVLAAGVVVSNAFVYHEVSLAPQDRLEELADLGDRTAGRGPVLYTEFEEFGKHFLRDSQPVGASESFKVAGLTPQLRDGGQPAFGYPVGIYELRPADVRRFRALVVRRSPDPGPPPAGFGLDWRGRYYELWIRGARGRLPAPPAHPAAEFATAKATLPPGWEVKADAPTLVRTVGPGRVSGSLKVRRAGRYRLWLRGSFGREVAVWIDGRRVGAVGDELAQPGNWIALGVEEVGAGPHRVELVRGGGDLSPGNGDGPRTLGSLAITPAAGPSS
jgi:hypothetical protein